MRGAEQVVHVWEEWGIQVLVLLSFTLQLMLLTLAEFRRHVDSGVLRFILWSAYLLADSAAIYVLGHMAVTSRSPEHELGHCCCCTLAGRTTSPPMPSRITGCGCATCRPWSCRWQELLTSSTSHPS